MSDIIPTGTNSSTGRFIPLASGDLLVNADNLLLGPTGAIGFSGLEGTTGLSNTQGVTGLITTGSTGTFGNTGLQGPSGETGLLGETGLDGTTGVSLQGITGTRGETGIQGATGFQGAGGVTGLSGITGLIGPTGLIGSTGIQGVTGFILTGSTGIRGDTGLLGNTGLVTGSTGVGIRGTTGIYGNTGLLGATGLWDPYILSVQSSIGGVTGMYALPSETIDGNAQQLEFWVSGISATNGATTTITVTFGGNTIFTDSISLAGGSDIFLYSVIYAAAIVAPIAIVSGIYETGNSAVQSNAIFLDFSGTPTLYVSLSSAGTGHSLYALVVKRFQAGPS